MMIILNIRSKSTAIHNEITRENVGQLLQSGEWFKKTMVREDLL